MQELMADFFLFRHFIIYLTSLDYTSLKQNPFGMIFSLILELLPWFSKKEITSEWDWNLRAILLIVKYQWYL